jgi:hypothetical protein
MGVGNLDEHREGSGIHWPGTADDGSWPIGWHRPVLPLGDSIRAWVQNNLQGFDEPTERFHGEVGPHAIASPQSGGPDQSLYCMVRKAKNLPSNDINRPITEALLTTIQKTPGFRGVYFVRSNDDPTRGASILFCDTRENATAAHEASLAIMRERRPETSVRVAASGKTAILVMA